MGSIKVIIADDHQLFRNSLQSLLGRAKSIDVVHTVSDGEELLDYLEGSDSSPDVILMDIRMKPINGFDSLKEVIGRYPDIKVIMVSMFDNPHNVIEAMRLGASSYLTKDSSTQEMIQAINSVFEKGSYTTEIMTKAFIKNIKYQPQTDMKKRIEGKDLSEDEKDVVRLICQEKTNEEIAAALSKSRRTVESIRIRIMDKIGCKNMIGIVKYAIKEGIFKEIDK